MKEQFPDRPWIVKASADLVKMVATARKLGCYGLAKPTGDESALAELCPTFVETVLLSWLALNAAAR
ncbi:hypothetical protein ABZX92_19415 [Lentzea sp. NPDC006480]|uniref:hypothetical protein n=1 Tax=Lentzea sp. NPDC006480 TaxID=3157176 RepID=UPI0033AED7D2